MTDTPDKIKFQPGKVVSTIGARLWPPRNKCAALVRRHTGGDWGEVPPEDAKANENALKWGERILSSYTINGERSFGC